MKTIKFSFILALWLVPLFSLAHPDLGRQHYVTSTSGERWVVLGDHEVEAEFYQVPLFFEVSSNEGGSQAINSWTRENGNLVLQISWQAHWWNDNLSLLETLIVAEHGFLPIWKQLSMEMVTVELDPSMVEDFGVFNIIASENQDLSIFSTFYLSFEVPAEERDSFFAKVVQEEGFANWVSLDLEAEDGSVVPYTTSFLLSGLSPCHLMENLSC